jgi:ABC-type sugar transport system ATPase subunit
MSDVEIIDLSKDFGNFTAVESANTVFKEGTVTVLLGPSGCGKTTLMRMIVGLEKPTAGQVLIGGQDVTKLATSKRRIGMVFQYPVIYRGTSVARNLELPLIADKISKAERKKRIDEVAEIVGITDLLATNVDKLDNAGRQKIAVAREVARKPEVLLFDEPITNVDLTSKLELKRALKNVFQELRQTIIYVTHDQTEAMSLADKIALMNEGRIVQLAPPSVLYNQPADVFAGWFLGNPGMNFLKNSISISQGILSSPFLASPLSIDGDSTGAEVLGIRPEFIGASVEQRPDTIEASVTSKSITIGGQALLELELEGQSFKAVIDHGSGKKMKDRAWISLPPSKLFLFDSSGRAIPVILS